MAESWRKDIDPMIRDHLEAQIRESAKYRKNYEKEKNKANVQLWIAIANLSRQIFNLNLKFNYLERALKDSLAQTSGAINLDVEKESPKKKKMSKTAKNY